jgi:bacterioferritin
MKGNENVLEKLNTLLAEELTAINQYMVHAEMCDDWGYKKLHQAVRLRAITEMKHAEKLIERILFLEGKPIVSELNKIHIGPDVPEQLRLDVAAEYGAIKSYNDAINLCVEAADNATKDLLQVILEDEDKHVNEIESLQTQIEQMGLQAFLTTQVAG